MPRPITSFASENANCGTEFAGQLIVRTLSAVISAPMSRSEAATITGLVGIDTSFAGMF